MGIVDIDGNPFVSSARRLVPVVGGALDGVMVPRVTDHPLMQLPVASESGKCIRMMFRWDVERWVFTGWADGGGVMIAEAGSEKCHRIDVEFALLVARLRDSIESKPSEPVNFGVDIEEEQDRRSWEVERGL